MNKKFISAIMALVVTIGVSFTSVHANPASDKAKIQQVQTQRSDLETKVEMMDNQIEKIMSKISGNETDMAKTQKYINQAQIDIAKAEDDIKAEQILFDKRMRVMYMSGSSNYIDIILSSNDVGDFISRLENIKKIINFDQNIINDYKKKRAVIDLKKTALDIENTKLVSLKSDNEKKLADLTKQKSGQTILLAQLKAQESQYGAQLVADQASIAASQVAIAKIRKAAPSLKKSTSTPNNPDSSSIKLTSSSINPDTGSKKLALSLKNPTSNSIVSRGGATFSSDSLIAYASNYLGLAYIWGGTTPAGFDCSGYTQYVFAHFGITIPRVSQDQQNVGKLISRADLQPGDLVFFGTPAHHVGIYIGNGNMISSPHTGDVIKIQPLIGEFTYGRRVY